MKRLLATLVLSACLLSLPLTMPAQTPARETKDAVYLSTPEAAIKSLFSAYTALDLKRLTACVEGAKYTAESETLEKLMKASRDRSSMVPTAFHLDTSGSVATGTLDLTVQLVLGPNSPTPKDPSVTEAHPGIPDSITLHRVGKDWLVVPAKIDSLDPLLQSGVVMATVAAAQPSVLVAGRNGAYGAKCAAHMRDLSLALMAYSMDHNYRFALKAEAIHATLLPYLIKDEKGLLESPRSVYANTERNAKLLAEQPFHCPNAESAEMSCRFNKNLEGLDILSIPTEEMGSLIAFYEGEDQKLSFRHNGKAVVGLANGHAKAVTPEEAKKLRWKP